MLKDDRNAIIAEIHAIVWNSLPPLEAAGWPPGLLEHIKTIIHNISIAIVDSIYTQKELDDKIESIILDKP